MHAFSLHIGQDLLVNMVPIKLCTVDEAARFAGQEPRQMKRCRGRIQRVVALSVADYRDFCGNLMAPREWLDGMGGTDSDHPRFHELAAAGVKSWSAWAEADRELFRKTSHLNVVAVVCAEARAMGGTMADSLLLVDPSGHSYARYIGFPA